jgi:hypothetical protein
LIVKETMIKGIRSAVFTLSPGDRDKKEADALNRKRRPSEFVINDAGKKTSSAACQTY